ncbi:MAG TPA: acetyl-coenzyme A synthetase N-terminal domain-containing protein, partial [Actinomycetota bacterium]|nr:acetyl-coenzyme A synthetase N-terminal domain-containing protein [Actinomycetota bacterium]
MVAEGEILWQPSAERRDRSNLARYLRFLEQTRGRSFRDYAELWSWSVDDLEGFWASVAEFFSVRWHRPPDAVLAERRMPGAVWFPGAELNYAERALAHRDDRVAVGFGNESGDSRS